MTYRIFYDTGATVAMLEVSERPTWSVMIGQRWLMMGNNKAIPESALIDITDEHGEPITLEG